MIKHILNAIAHLFGTKKEEAAPQKAEKVFPSFFNPSPPPDNIYYNLRHEKYELVQPGYVMENVNGDLDIIMVVESSLPERDYLESDPFLFFLNEDGYLPSGDQLLYYNNPKLTCKTAEGSVEKFADYDIYNNNYCPEEDVIGVNLSKVPDEIRTIRCFCCAFPCRFVYGDTQQSFVAFRACGENGAKTVLSDMTRNRNSMVHSLFDKWDEWIDKYGDKDKVYHEAYKEAAENKTLLNGFGSVHFMDIERMDTGNWRIKVVCEPDDSTDGLIMRYYKDSDSNQDDKIE